MFQFKTNFKFKQMICYKVNLYIKNLNNIIIILILAFALDYTHSIDMKNNMIVSFHQDGSINEWR
jgi:hypothetical protein